MPSLHAQKLPPAWGPDRAPVRHQHVADAVEAALAQIRALQLEVAYVGRRHALQQGMGWHGRQECSCAGTGCVIAGTAWQFLVLA